MKILGIEASCDDTSVAIIDPLDKSLSHRIRANITQSQISVHKKYGGVVPEYAARNHMSSLEDCVIEALERAGVGLDEIGVIAVTAGPGLVGGLLVGTVFAKTLAMALNKPFMAINHLEGHMLTVRLCYYVPFPFLLCLASGGHFIFAEIVEVGKYRILGETLDDAAGECLDKVAKLLGLEYPGGPNIEKLAQHGNPQRFKFPAPMLKHNGCNVSFSGLKTAARNLIQTNNYVDKSDIAASFQMSVMSFIVRQARKAIDMCNLDISSIVLAGGVAANKLLRSMFEGLASNKGLRFYAPPLNLCSDNAAMIAWAAFERINAGYPYSPITASTNPRWALA